MNKVVLNKPLVLMLYSYPGAGKTHFARQLTEGLSIAHIQGDRIRYEIFDQPRFDQQESTVVNHLMEYMTEELLRAGISVIFDTNVIRASQRLAIRDLARKMHAGTLLVWLQIDQASAFDRVNARDRRRNDDRLAVPLDSEAFDSLSAHMQNPQSNEDYVVISGKHNFNTQRSAVIKKLYEMGYIEPQGAAGQVIKPGLVNLIPNLASGRVDNTRRNITIR